MRKLINLSYLIQSGKDTSIFTDKEIEDARKMHEYVRVESNGFTCSFKYLETLWLAAYFKVAGYNGNYN